MAVIFSQNQIRISNRLIKPTKNKTQKNHKPGDLKNRVQLSNRKTTKSKSQNRNPRKLAIKFYALSSLPSKIKIRSDRQLTNLKIESKIRSKRDEF